MAAGAELGVVNAGYYAIESMRLEKGYRAFGRELTPDYGPVEAGLLFACKLRTPVGFLGREAVEKARKIGPRRRLVSLVASDPEVTLWGGELVLRDGAAVGQLTSAAWGEALGARWAWPTCGTRPGTRSPRTDQGRAVRGERGRRGITGHGQPGPAVRSGQCEDAGIAGNGAG